MGAHEHVLSKITSIGDGSCHGRDDDDGRHIQGKFGGGRKDSGFDEPQSDPSSATQGGYFESATQTVPLSPVGKWLEVWDYAGGATFRGFTTEDTNGERTLFIFFDKATSRDLKKGLMALIDLASASSIDSSNLVVCLDRGSDNAYPNASLMRDLNWVGFELKTLSPWIPGGFDVTSERWLFLGMEI